MPSPIIPDENTPSPTSSKEIAFPDKNAVKMPFFSSVSSGSGLELSAFAGAFSSPETSALSSFCSACGFPIVLFPAATVRRKGAAAAIAMQTAKDAI